MVRAIRASQRQRSLPRLASQNAFPHEPCHVRHHRIAEGEHSLWSRGNPRRLSENRGLAYPLLKFRKLDRDTNPADQVTPVDSALDTTQGRRSMVAIRGHWGRQ
jgi:hypothetical protein